MLKNDTERKEIIFQALRNAALMIGGDITQERLMVYTENAARDFQNMPLNQLQSFFDTLAKTCKFFPSYAEILEKADGGATDRDKGMLISGEIVNAISRFGQYQTIEAKEHLGKTAWYVVERSGGWHDLCLIQNSDLPAVRAQLRDIATSALKLKNKKTNFTELENKANKEMLSLGDSLKGLLSE